MSKSNTRQYPLVMHVPVTFADLLAGVSLSAGDLPGDAVVLRGHFVVTTAWDTGTSDVLDVGLNAQNDLANDLDLKTTGAKALTGIYVKPTGVAGFDVTLKSTAVGTAPTAGEGYLVLEYIGTNRVSEVAS